MGKENKKVKKEEYTERKFYISLFSILCLSVLGYVGKIQGETLTWGIVSVVGISMGGFASEYIWKNKIKKGGKS
jgi:hypothetical protein